MTEVTMAEDFACNRIKIESGITLHYATRGSGSETIVLLHGLGANLQAWNDLAPLFPPDRYRLYLLDLKGSGKSDKPLQNRYSLKDHAEAIAAFLQNMELSDVTLVGQSMGGAIALVTAINEQEQRQ